MFEDHAVLFVLAVVVALQAAAIVVVLSASLVAGSMLNADEAN
jgi:hypothetical protein